MGDDDEPRLHASHTPHWAPVPWRLKKNTSGQHETSHSPDWRLPPSPPLLEIAAFKPLSFSATVHVVTGASISVLHKKITSH